MAPTTKEAQRAELHKTIWRIANDLRGSVDGWDFKSYVLGMLFYRFHLRKPRRVHRQGRTRRRRPHVLLRRPPRRTGGRHPPRHGVGEGVLHPPLGALHNVRRRGSRDVNLNETLERVFKNIEGSALGTDSEDQLKGLFDDLDVNSNRLANTVAKRNEKLVKLLDAIGDLPLGNFQDNSIDLFGDAYEYLMQMYASQAGKSGGEYYTPAGSVGGPRPHHRDGEDPREQGLRPGRRVGVAAAEVREDPRQGQRRRVLRAGNQPDHLQPRPHQHVPS